MKNCALSGIRLGVLAVLAGWLISSVAAQQMPSMEQGIASDWSMHHVIFSNPGTEQEAVANGTYERWLKVVNDPRYIFQQLKRGEPVQGPAAEAVAAIEAQARAEGQSMPLQPGGIGNIGNGQLKGLCAADRPRISYSVWPGPAVRMEMPGTLVTISSTVVMFSCLKSSLVSAVMLIGVACTVDSRFSAVTTISSNSVPPLAAGAGVAGFGGPAGSAIAGFQKRAVANRVERIDEARNAAVSAAHNAFFIFFSLDQHIERPPSKCPKAHAPAFVADFGIPAVPFGDPLVIGRVNS